MDRIEILKAVQTAKSLPSLILTLKSGGADPLHFDWAARMFLDSRARERAEPLKGTFELTPLCNFSCKMCYVHLSPEQIKGRKLLTAAEWESIMAQAVDSGMIFAALTGGECLMHPDFERLYLFLYNKSVRVTVLTNGELLNEDKIEFLSKYPPFCIQLTLYGASEEMYERVTGRRAFEKVVRNIRLACEAHLPLRLSVTPNNSLTKEENMEVIRLASTFPAVFQVSGGLMEPRAETERNQGFSDLNTEDYIDFFMLEKSLRGEALPEECEVALPPVNASENGAPRGLRCGGARSSFNVTWGGRMVPCNRLTHISAEPLKDGFAAAWQKIHNGVTDYLLPAECEGCVYANAAKGCAAEHNGTGHASPQQCEWCRAIVRSGLAKLIKK